MSYEDHQHIFSTQTRRANLDCGVAKTCSAESSSERPDDAGRAKAGATFVSRDGCWRGCWYAATAVANTSAKQSEHLQLRVSS